MSKTNGNAFLYVLISLILLGILTFTLSNSDSQTPISDQADGNAKVVATQIIGYASTISSVYLQMEQTGTDLDELVLTRPSEAGFNTAPTLHKLFHPDGGGLSYKDAISQSYIDTTKAFPNDGWIFSKSTNVGWTPTTADDFLVALGPLKTDICQEINRALTGSTTIPVFSGDLENTFNNRTDDFLSADCAGCAQRPSLCLTDGGIGGNVFYSIIKAR